jgi:hypothetical protein
VTPLVDPDWSSIRRSDAILPNVGTVSPESLDEGSSGGFAVFFPDQICPLDPVWPERLLGVPDQRLHLLVEKIDRAVDIPLERDGRDVVDDDSEVLLGFMKALLEVLALCDVEEQAADIFDPALGIADDVTPLMDPDLISGPGVDPVLPDIGLAAVQGIDEGLLDETAVSFEDQVGPLPLPGLEVLLGVARHGLHLPVEEIDAAVGVASKDDGRNVVENGLEVPVHCP